MTPRDLYQSQLAAGAISGDEAQAAAVEHLEETFHTLVAGVDRAQARKSWVLGLLAPRRTPPPAPGLYLWGGVGRGKTWLMDLFFDSLPFEHKQRLHFHRFMNQVHRSMALLQGRSDPLDRVALELAAEVRVLCLDEFLVIDIGDAMILHQLLKALFRRGVTLVTTSNVQPEDLYKNGLQRNNFLPAIDLIKEHTRVVSLGPGTDYRLRFLSHCEIYHAPHTRETDGLLEEEFAQLAPNEGLRDSSIRVVDRDIPVKRVADDVVWFDFEALCGPPRSQADYIEVARCYHTVFVSDVPVMGDGRDQEARRFIFLVDVLYDRNVKIILSAARAPDELYTGKRLAFEFQRTESRLLEMQSLEWQGRAHRP